jgi:anti-sigma B factor antagonist
MEEGMELNVHEYKRATILAVVGRVDSATWSELESALQAIIDQGQKHIILDLAGVEFLSSSGLRVLVTTMKELRKVGGEMVLAAASDRASDSINIAGLDVLFRSFPSREEAIASF